MGGYVGGRGVRPPSKYKLSLRSTTLRPALGCQGAFWFIKNHSFEFDFFDTFGFSPAKTSNIQQNTTKSIIKIDFEFDII